MLLEGVCKFVDLIRYAIQEGANSITEEILSHGTDEALSISLGREEGRELSADGALAKNSAIPT